jgi:hypothetical protein
MSVSGEVEKTPTAPVDFTELCLGFSSAALYYLGVVPVEGQSAPQKNLPLARQNIDILILLREKTKGNLSADEAALVDHLVSDLQVKLVEATRQ